MNRYSVAWLSGLLLCMGSAMAEAYHARGVTIDVIDKHGRNFEEYPIESATRTYRAYLKARRGAPYRIRLTNHTGERVGVVVTVDGRNIVSGQRSDLGSRESMYVLDPWESGEYRGWRTSLSETNEFYFTDWQDSYAEAFGDRSARGVIAVAVYRDREWQARLAEERRAREQLAERERSYGKNAPSPSPNSADAAAGAAGEKSARAEVNDKAAPGTGYGERQYDPAQRVHFVAEHRPMQRSFLKYEWPETLCQRGFGCERPRERNRFWPDDRYGFAPPPPGRD